MYKGENRNVNQQLWKRFLEKRGYSGIYCENGREIRVVRGSLKLLPTLPNGDRNFLYDWFGLEEQIG